MNDLLQTIALAGGQWAGSTENLEGPVEANGGSRSRHMKELGSMAYSTNAINYTTLTLPSGNRAKRSLKIKDNASCEDVPASSDDPIGFRGQASQASSLHSIKTISSNTSHSTPLEAKGALNGNLSRPHSESSGEFSLSLDQEEWSSGSSPVQQPLSHSSHQSSMLLQRSLDPQATQAKKKNGSASGNASEVLSLQQFLEEHIDPAESGSQENLTESSRLSGGAEHVQRDRAERGSTGTKGRGILRSASGKAAPVNSDGRPTRGGQPGHPSLRKAESTRVKGMALPRVSLSSQSKAVSVSERLDISSSMLPRASSVISTAEGSTRRTSIHDLLSKDTRQPVSVDPSPSSKALPRAYTTPNVEVLQERRKSKSSGEQQSS
nr:girdin-like isoform X2 [Oncorhynchus nerka]